MTLVVSVKYSTTPGGYPGCGGTVRIESLSTRTSDVKEIVQARYPHMYNLQIAGIKKA